MEKMEGKTESLETVNNNNALLLAQLNNVINKLQIPYNYQVVPLEEYFAGGMETYHPPPFLGQWYLWVSGGFGAQMGDKPSPGKKIKC